MGLEGAASIIHRKELEAIGDVEQRRRSHRDRTDELKRYNTALEVAARFGYDDVIDPADTRAILLNTLATLPAPLPRTTRKRMIEPY